MFVETRLIHIKMASCFWSLIVILHFYICHGALLANEPRTTEKNKSTEKDSDLLRQLLNQETLMRMSLARDVQSLLKYQRMAEEGRQAPFDSCCRIFGKADKAHVKRGFRFTKKQTGDREGYC